MTRVIFDAEASPDLQKFAQAVLGKTDRFHCHVGDIHWSALGGWRTLLSSLFNAPEALAHLEQSKRIEIQFNRQPIGAAYLQGWLAAQLGWAFKGLSKGEKRWTLTYDTLEIELVSQDLPSLPPGVVLSVEVESRLSSAHYVFKRHPESRQVFMQFSDEARCDLPSYAFLPGLTEGQEVIQEIFYPQPQAHYHNMLKWLTQIPWSSS